MRFYEAGAALEFGDLVVQTIPTPHDAVDGVTFLVADKHRKLGILTDLGHTFDGLPQLISELNLLYLESNYDPDMLENGSYPPDRLPRQAPDELEEYVKGLDWSETTPLGGSWDWDHNSVGITAGVTVIGATASLADLQRVDDRIDDGDLLTGRFRRTGAGGYTYEVAD